MANLATALMTMIPIEERCNAPVCTCGRWSRTTGRGGQVLFDTVEDRFYGSLDRVLCARPKKRGDSRPHPFAPGAYYSMIKFFVLDVPLRRVVAVSIDPAPDSAFAPSFFDRPTGQLPVSQYTTFAP